MTHSHTRVPRLRWNAFGKVVALVGVAAIVGFTMVSPAKAQYRHYGFGFSYSYPSYGYYSYPSYGYYSYPSYGYYPYGSSDYDYDYSSR